MTTTILLLFYHGYIWNSIEIHTKESTYAHYSYTLHKYLLPVLSEVPIASLEESFLEQAMQQIIAPADAAHKPLGSSSARECLSMLRRICKYAAHLRLIRPMELEVRLGTFQLSDLFYNTVGGALGGLMYYAAMKARKHQ